MYDIYDGEWPYSKPKEECKSGYVGVSIESRGRTTKYKASIFLPYCNADGWRKQWYLGTFNTAEEAAEAFDNYARQLYGPLAEYNLPQEDW